MKTLKNLIMIGCIAALVPACGSSSGGGGDGGPDTGPDGGNCDTTYTTGEFADCDCVEVISGQIESDTTWTADTCYAIRNTVFVVGAELTINAGTRVLGVDDGQSSQAPALVVTSTGTIRANGTAAAPIVFGPGDLAEDGKVPGDFGGVVLLGTATTNKGEDNIEGIPVENNLGAFGSDNAANDTHDCGTLTYVRIEFAGFVLGVDNELNGLTVGGCGSDTTLSYIQIHLGLDDGIEFFGGTAGLDHAVITGAGDDGLDWDQGWRGAADNIIVHHFAPSSSSPRAIEADNSGSDFAATPRSDPTINHMTIIGDGSILGMKLREGTRGALSYFLIEDVGQAVDIDDRQEQSDSSTILITDSSRTSASWPDTLVIENSIFTTNTRIGDSSENDSDGGKGSFDEEGEIEDDARGNSTGNAAVLTIGSITAPNYSPTGDVSIGGSYAGAIDPGAADWTAGWTAYPAAATN